MVIFLKGGVTMQTALKEQMLTVLRGALNDEPVMLDTPLELPALSTEAARHGIENMLFFGARAAGKDKNDPEMKALLRTVGQRIFVTENQITEAEAVCAAFEKAGIDYLPLKGMTLRELYPAVDMRTMGDVDILIREQQYPLIEKVLKEQGFTFVLESGHEYNWKKQGVLYLELHKALFASYETDFYSVFGDGWERAQRVDDTHRHTLSFEDQFLYVFVHFAKHYRGGGVGLRHLADIAMYLRNGNIQDTMYVEQQLKALHMLEFYHNILDVIAAWLGDGEMTEKSAFILQQIWTSGVYGTLEAHRTADAERAATGSVKTAKIRHIWQLLFPFYGNMALKYPILKKAPALLPILWPVRWVTAGLLHPRHTIKKGNAVKAVSVNDIRDKQQALRYVGLEPMADRSQK